MSRTFPKQKRKDKAADKNKKVWLFVIIIGVAAGILIARIATFSLPETAPKMELKVEDLFPGEGREAMPGDTLIVEYTGWIKGNDTPFDSSKRYNKPYEFVLGEGRVIEGWEEGLKGMKVSGVRKLVIPPDMAYGEDGTPDGEIPPNATLVFEIELLDVVTTLAELPPTSITELKVEDIRAGRGSAAKAGSTLRVHYTGWLEDGSVFDSSRREEPIEFVLGNGEVIEGWEQGLPGMRVGGLRKLIIPPELGYGVKGARNYVPANSALIFEVELLEVR